MPTAKTSTAKTKKAPAGATKKKTARKAVKKKAVKKPDVPTGAGDVQDVPLALIVNDPSLQTRVDSDGDQIDNLKAALEEDASVPPIVLFKAEPKFTDATRYFIGDGWHRYFAHQELGRKSIYAEVRPGGRAEALKYALGANAAHGLRRTNADKRKAVTLALKEYPKLSDRQIADLCKVSHPTVAAWRKELVNFTSSTRIGADGKERRLPQKPEQIDFFKLLDEQHDAFAKQGKVMMKELELVITNPEAPREKKLEEAKAILAHAERLKTEINDLITSLETQEA